MFRAYGITEKGRIRPINEDCFAIDEAVGLCVVADGMGGHNAGEVAARLAVDTVVDFVRDRSAESLARASGGNGRANLPPSREASADGRRLGGSGAGERESDRWPFGYDDSLSADGNLLRTAIYLANVHILETAITADRYAGMGTTLVVARAADGRLTVGHAGDSRLYLLAADGLRQVTRDDSWMASVLDEDPAVDPIVLMHHPMRNALTNVVGARSRTDVHVVDTSLAGDELLLLTTDGVHGVLDDRRLERLLKDDEDPQVIARNVILAALAHGSRDNCTVIVAQYLRDEARHH